jgi:uncharacterized protein with FMN-binding domain
MKQGVIKKISLAAAAVILLGAASETSLTAASPVLAVSKKASSKKVSFHVYQKGTKKTSMAQGFIGKSATVTIKNGRVTSLKLHVDGNNSPLGKGQDVAKIVKSLTINHVKGKKVNVASDHHSFDFVFPAAAFKSGARVPLSVTIDFGGSMKEDADLKFSKLAGIKAVKQSKKTSHKHKKASKKHKKTSKKHKKSHKKASHKRVSKRRR